MLKLMIEEWRWISRDEHVPRFSGIDRETESECARFDCMFTNVDYALIENEDADTTRARPPPLSVPFLFFQSFHRPPDENQNKRALPPPKAAKHSLKYILKYILFREPGNRNLTFIPRGNNTTPFEKTFVQHDSSSPKFFSSPWKRIYPNNVRILYEYQRIIIIVPTRFPQFLHSKLRNNSFSIIVF